MTTITQHTTHDATASAGDNNMAAGVQRRYDKAERCRLAARRLVANGNSTPPDTYRIVNDTLTSQHPGSIERQLQRWKLVIVDLHRWRGHTANIPAEST